MKLQVWIVVLACITVKIIHDSNIIKCIYKICLSALLKLWFLWGNDYALGKKVFSFISSRVTTLWFYCLAFPSMSLSRWKWEVDQFPLCPPYYKKIGEQLYKNKHNQTKKKQKTRKSTFPHPDLGKASFPIFWCILILDTSIEALVLTCYELPQGLPYRTLCMQTWTGTPESTQLNNPT